MSEPIAVFCAKALGYLFPLSWIGLAVVIIVLLPLAVFRRTRRIAGIGMLLASLLFGITTWFQGAFVTFAIWGWFGLLIGLFLFGVGVVPIGILAAFSVGKIDTVLSLILLSVITFACRYGGAALYESASQQASKAQQGAQPDRQEQSDQLAGENDVEEQVILEG